MTLLTEAEHMERDKLGMALAVRCAAKCEMIRPGNPYNMTAKDIWQTLTDEEMLTYLEN